jgi:hypothetical protein
VEGALFNQKETTAIVASTIGRNLSPDFSGRKALPSWSK